MKKLLLRSFNNECDYSVDNVKFNFFDRQVARIEKSLEAAKKLGRILNAQVTEAKGSKQSRREDIHAY